MNYANSFRHGTWASMNYHRFPVRRIFWRTSMNVIGHYEFKRGVWRKVTDWVPPYARHPAFWKLEKKRTSGRGKWNHPDEGLLDRYALGRITDPGELARIEEHLLVCEPCRQAVTLVDQIRTGRQPAKPAPAKPVRHQ